MAFYVRLKKFFQKHDPDRLYMVKKIVRNFAAQEDDVMARLEEIYSSGGPSKLSPSKIKSSPISSLEDSTVDSSSISHDIEQQFSENHETEQPKKKSKKKLISVVFVVIILSVGAYLDTLCFSVLTIMVLTMIMKTLQHIKSIQQTIRAQSQPKKPLLLKKK